MADMDAIATNPARSDQPFGRPVVPAPEGLLWTKWRALSANIASDMQALARYRAEPERAPPAGARFLAIVERALAQDGLARIDVVNRGVNMSLRYVRDLENRHSPDHWSGPLDTFAAACGDCEDFAAAKYSALLTAGMAASGLRLVLVFDTASGEHHMIAAASDEGRWVILDNRNLLLLEDRQLPSFEPLFLFGEAGLQQYGRSAPAGRFSLAERLAGRAQPG
jgi:predicted transglutaminase-like cysteine proteinase